MSPLRPAIPETLGKLIRSLSERSVYIYRGHVSAVKAACWSPDGIRIASGGDDRTIQVWDATTGCNLFAFTAHQGVVNTLAWSPDGQHIASAGVGKKVRVRELRTLNQAGTSAYMAPEQYPLSLTHLRSPGEEGQKAPARGPASTPNRSCLYTLPCTWL